MKPGLLVLIALLLAAQSGAVVTGETREPAQPPTGTTGDVPAVAPRPRRVLALYSEASDQPVMVSFAQTFHDVLKERSGNTVEQYPEYFDSVRFPGESQKRLMFDYLRRKYADRTIDVVFAWGPFALPLVLEYRAELFPDTPIVYYSGTLDEVRDYQPPPMTGVLNPDTYERTLEVALRLHPDTKEVFIISGTPARDKSIERDMSRQLEEFQDRVKLTYLTDLPLDRLIATVKSLPRQSIIIYSRQQSDEGTGRVLQQSDYLDLVSRSAPVPVYGPWRSLLGYGSVGGVVDDRDAGATKAAEIVLRVARGTRPQDIPPDRTPRIPTFDSRQLNRWRISEDRLPPGSVILFRQASLWNQYRYYVIGTGAVVAVQGLLIGGLLVQRARRRRVEGALRESEQARVRQMSEQKRELEVQVAERTQEVAARSQRVAVLEERARLSRELHDSVTQSLHSIGLYVSAAGRAMAIGKADVGTAHLHEAQQLAQEAMHEMRALIFELRPAVLEERGLGPALRARLDSVEARTGVAVSLDTSGAPDDRRLPVETELELYRMVQEALNNVIKHARARHVWVTLAYRDRRPAETEVRAEGEPPGGLVLEIRDDGAGFDLNAAEERPTTGLRSLAERAAKIGGTVTIDTAPDRGTTVRIELKTDGL